MTLKSFKDLLKSGNIGFYKRCEVIDIYLNNKKEKKVINLYKLITFQENPIEDNNSKEYLTNELKYINDNYSLGITKDYMSLQDAKDCFNDLKNNNIWRFKDDFMRLYDLNLIPKQFVCETYSPKPRIINILKDSSRNNYILEFFNENKQFSINKNRDDFNKICEYIKEYSGFDFKKVPERLGNIIFQFPINILTANVSRTKKGIKLSVEWHEKIKHTQRKKTPKYIVNIFAEEDNVISGTCYKVLKKKFYKNKILMNYLMINHLRIPLLS